VTEYLIPHAIEEVLHLLLVPDGRALIIAGGTDLLPDLRKGKYAPGCLVDITRIPELARIEIEDNAEVQPETTGNRSSVISADLRTPEPSAVNPRVRYVTVGAAVTFARLREHPYLQQHVHALVEAAASVGAAPIQSTATWGGNLVQAMPAADGAIIAITLEAELRVVDRDGERWIPVRDTFAGPGRSHIDPTRQLIAAIRFPIPATPWGTAWRRAGRRPSLILPTLNCAVKLVLNEDRSRITDAAIGMGPVGSCPHRAAEAEVYLVGRTLDPETFTEAARLSGHDADPRSSIHRASREYRLAILPALVEEALGVAAERAHRSLSEE
jgi:CO/xanthine dehydrogenase FAD-binding subunit